MIEYTWNHNLDDLIDFCLSCDDETMVAIYKCYPVRSGNVTGIEELTIEPIENNCIDISTFNYGEFGFVYILSKDEDKKSFTKRKMLELFNENHFKAWIKLPDPEK